VFPHDILPGPRSYAEVFVNVQAFAEHAAGGHFAAWEQPAAYAADLDRAVRLGSASLGQACEDHLLEMFGCSGAITPEQPNICLILVSI
jgi:hypothetical protein